MVIKPLYQWFGEIREQMPSLSKPQAQVLALFSFGVARARHCFASRVSEKLWEVGKADTVERRLQRFLANPRLCVERCCRQWAKWVLSHLVSDDLVLLVDETKLGKWLGIMVIGLAYRKRCIPLAWRCYRQGEWPMGQVAVIEELMGWIADAIPSGCIPLLQADRGIGTSPDLIRAAVKMDWDYLFRVQNHTRFRFLDGREVSMESLVERGGQWQGEGHAFKKAGWLPVHAHVIWKAAYDEPWCLITNRSSLAGTSYAVRAWQEQSFKDLKSSGWQWQDSQVRIPDHADRLVLVLALAYAWMLALGTMAVCLADDIKSLVTRGHKRTRYGVFRQGIRYFAHLSYSQRPICTRFLFIPLKPCP